MTKELEALERIVELRWGTNDFNLTIRQTNKQDVETIEQALTELQAIKEANPSEALKCLKDIYRNGVFISDYDALGKQHATNISPETNKSISEQCNTIKQALLKAEKLEKVLEILKSKDTLYTQIKYCNSVDEYNKLVEYTNFDKLTQEEFDLLKEMLG